MINRRKAWFVIVAAALLTIGTGCQEPEPFRLRVMSYNIRHGEGLDGKIDLERIAKVIDNAHVDLVALQEVDRGVERSGREDQPARLGKLTGMKAIFEKNIDFQGGEYGNAVLSRLPVLSHQNHHLPRSLPQEQRGMLEVHVRADRQEVVFLATHFDYHPDDGERLASADMLRERVEALGRVPVIAAGDLNARPDSPVITKLLEFMYDTYRTGSAPLFTFPANNPDRRIDYILQNAYPLLAPMSYQVIDDRVASDHRPVVAEFILVTGVAQ